MTIFGSSKKDKAGRWGRMVALSISTPLPAPQDKGCVKGLHGFIVALLLTVIYLAPLAPPVKSPKLAHAIAGECHVNYDMSGCSAERRAKYTCCCGRKKLPQQQYDSEHRSADCCGKKYGDNPHALSCGCRCGGEKQPLAFAKSVNDELLISHFSQAMPGSVERQSSVSYGKRFKDRCGEPPEPPPKGMSA